MILHTAKAPQSTVCWAFFSVILFYSISTVIESHPDNALEDLRLDQPFPELKKHIESYDLDSMEKKVRGWLS